MDQESPKLENEIPAENEPAKSSVNPEADLEDPVANPTSNDDPPAPPPEGNNSSQTVAYVVQLSSSIPLQDPSSHAVIYENDMSDCNYCPDNSGQDNIQYYNSNNCCPSWEDSFTIPYLPEPGMGPPPEGISKAYWRLRNRGYLRPPEPPRWYL